jgi:hypothetical protein
MGEMCKHVFAVGDDEFDATLRRCVVGGCQGGDAQERSRNSHDEQAGGLPVFPWDRGNKNMT